MKNTTKLKIWGFMQLFISIILIILAVFVFNEESLINTPNFLFLVPGMFGLTFSLPIILAGFSPEIAKFTSKMKSETITHAKSEIKEAAKNKAETVIPAVTPEVKKAFKEIKNEKSIEDKLKEAKRLLDNKIITEKEYKEIRTRILDNF